MTQSVQPNTDAAIRQHEVLTQARVEGFKSVINSATAALRLLATINAGGILALLAFIGSIAGKDHKVFESVTLFSAPITNFGIGLVLSVAATCGMYLAQFFFALESANLRQDYQFPFVHKTAASKRLSILGIAFQISTIIAAFVSFFFFIYALCKCVALIELAKL